MVPRRQQSDNHGLTSVPYILTSRRGRWWRVFAMLVLLIAVAVLSAGLALRYYPPPPAPPAVVEPSARLDLLEQENRELKEALTRSRFELGVELATRNELERQVQSLNEQLGQLREELAFLKSAGGRTPPAERPAPRTDP